MLFVVLAEGAGADKGHELAGLAVLFAQLFCGTVDEFGDCFEQIFSCVTGWPSSPLAFLCVRCIGHGENHADGSIDL